MYNVVRRSLKLSAGKVGAQVGHAVMYLCQEVIPEHWPSKEMVELQSLVRTGLIVPEELARLKTLREEDRKRSARCQIAHEWMKTPTHTKITLGATDEEFAQVSAEHPHHFLVIDFGFTEVEPNTMTTIGLWPMRKSARSPLLLSLKPL